MSIFLTFLVHLILFCKIPNTYADRKMWLLTTNISDPMNWEDGEAKIDCPGLIFLYEFHYIYVDILNLKSLTLPEFGKVILKEASEIRFDELSTDIMNCVQIVGPGTNDWTTPHLWYNLDNPDNPAVPYIERLPSRYDDVIFPTPLHAASIIINAEVKSVSLQTGSFTDVELSETDFNLMITNDTCLNPAGCVKKWSQDYLIQNTMCSDLEKQDWEPQCTDPLYDYSFCNVPKCGAVVTIRKLKKDFRISKIQDALKKYKSPNFAGRLYPDEVKIFFTEKVFSGSSFVDAMDFYEKLIEDGSYDVDAISIEFSGLPNRFWINHLKSARSFIFSILLWVIILFGVFFLVSNLKTNIFYRFLSNRPLTTYVMHYNNIEDRGYIVDSQSIVDLNQSFDNPIYDHQSTSTSTKVLSMDVPELIAEEKIEDDAL